MKIIITLFFTLLLSNMACASTKYLFAYSNNSQSDVGAQCFVCIKKDDHKAKWCRVNDRCYARVKISDIKQKCEKDYDVVMPNFHRQSGYYRLNTETLIFDDTIDLSKCYNQQ